MMITKTKQFKKLLIDAENWQIAIVFVDRIEEDGVEIARSKPHRRAFVPGQIEEVKAFTGLGNTNKHIQYINSLWTQQVIDNYLASLPNE